MKATRWLLVLLLLIGGCGGCEREPAGNAPGANAPGAAGGAKAPAAGEGKIQVAPPQATGAAKAPGGAEGGPAGAAPQGAEEPDCIVIADANPDYGPPPLAVEFTAEAECTEGQPTYKWDFGDGSNGTEANPTHTYSKAGDYTATVTVTAGSATATDEIDITVEEGEDAAE